MIKAREHTSMLRYAAITMSSGMTRRVSAPPPSVITGLQPSDYIVFTSYSTGLPHIPQRDARQAGAAYMLPLP